MSDLIDRQATIDTLDKHLRTTDVPVSYPGIISALTEWLNELPSAQPVLTCKGCKYDYYEYAGCRICLRKERDLYEPE